MTRTKDFLPSVPTTYRGIEVCDHVANRWIAYEGSMWRMGVDMALDEVIGAVESDCKELAAGSMYMYPDDWSSGLDEGKERAADYITDTLYTYKKEPK